ncbi:MAG: hypothetical protein J6M06_01335 [Synergistaceae bacterium]|nr:hypothetical protein [Synergistaceae bacterium]
MNKEKLEKAFEDYEQEFTNDFNYTNRHTKSYAACMWEIMEKEDAIYFDENGQRKKVKIRDRDRFEEITRLGESTFDRIKADKEGWVPSLRTFMTLCMVYCLNMTMVEKLRASYGYGFNAKDRVHQAYIFLLTKCRGKSLSYCNGVLDSLEIDKKYFLGDGTIDKDTIIQEL